MATRVTIRIDEDLLDRITVRAARERATATSLVEQELHLAEGCRAQQALFGHEQFRLPTFDIGESKPDVDINDNAALRDLMDRE